MASPQIQEFEVNTARDALAMLSRLVYEKFGKEALPLIAGVCHKLGVASGGKMKGDMSTSGLKAAGEAFMVGVRKRKSPVEVLEMSDEKLYIRGYRCALGLANTSRELCEAMMAMDKAIFETSSGKKLNLEIAKTVAAGDPYCDTIYTVVK